MDFKNTAIALVVVAVASAGITRYCFPKLEYKNIEVVKEGTKAETQNNIKTVIKYIERPDGTKETVTESTDQSTKKESTKKESSKETTIASKNQWMFDIGTRYKLSDKQQYYDLQVQRRIVGPFFVGAKASTDKTVGVSIGMEF